MAAVTGLWNRFLPLSGINCGDWEAGLFGWDSRDVPSPASMDAAVWGVATSSFVCEGKESSGDESCEVSGDANKNLVCFLSAILGLV